VYGVPAVELESLDSMAPADGRWIRKDSARPERSGAAVAPSAGVGSSGKMGERAGGSGTVEGGGGRQGAVAAREPRRLTGPEAGSGGQAGPRPTDGAVAWRGGPAGDQ
jgi:hypothetical protein